MTLPQKLDSLSQEDRKILGEFYNSHVTKQWFERAEITLNEQEGRKVLEVVVNYAPLLEMKDILEFAQKYNLKVETVDLSHR